MRSLQCQNSISITFSDFPRGPDMDHYSKEEIYLTRDRWLDSMQKIAYFGG